MNNQDTNTSKAAQIKLLILDVDGVLTDGSITYASEGTELKSFYVRDGLGIKMLHQAGINTAIITGRESPAVSKRAKELNIGMLIQGRDDKYIAAKELLVKLKIQPSEMAYMGDDLPDLAAIEFSGLGICPSNACEQVLQSADYVTQREGGCGAAREACEFILSSQDKLQPALQAFYLSNIK